MGKNKGLESSDQLGNFGHLDLFAKNNALDTLD